MSLVINWPNKPKPDRRRQVDGIDLLFSSQSSFWTLLPLGGSGCWLGLQQLQAVGETKPTMDGAVAAITLCHELYVKAPTLTPVADPMTESPELAFPMLGTSTDRC
jgi:hypothetical protein